MAQTKNKPSPKRHRFDMIGYIKRYANRNFLHKLIFDPNYLHLTCWALLVFEVILNVFIIQRIRYTEIDWIAYMQEVEGFLNGTWDYKDLKGDTGPLVYPAGFVYIYSVLYFVTSHGENIRLAQYIFLVLYMLQLYFSFEIYRKTQKVPPYALILCTLTSYRIHSIFVLRLFNDPIAVLLFYISLHCFLSNKWITGCIFYSFAVSVKMNILLYAPCLLIACLTNLTYKETLINLCVCGLVQLILGLPFLYANFWSYIRGSFDLARIFDHKWTVNYRFLDRHLFEDRYFHLSLLILHLLLLLAFLPLIVRYLRSYNALIQVVADLKKRKRRRSDDLNDEQRQFLDGFERQLQRSDVNRSAVRRSVLEEVDFGKTARLFVLPFFVTNLIGVVCARSLHYQFYSWYFHSLLYLVHCTQYRKPVMFLILAVIEFCWNTYPSTVLSSCLLHGCHGVLLFGLYKSMKE